MRAIGDVRYTTRREYILRACQVLCLPGFRRASVEIEEIEIGLTD